MVNGAGEHLNQVDHHVTLSIEYRDVKVDRVEISFIFSAG